VMYGHQVNGFQDVNPAAQLQAFLGYGPRTVSIARDIAIFGFVENLDQSTQVTMPTFLDRYELVDQFGNKPVIEHAVHDPAVVD